MCGKDIRMIAKSTKAGFNPSVKRKKWWRSLIYLILFPVCFYAFIVVFLAWSTVSPKPSKMRTNPGEYRMSYESVSFQSQDGTPLSSWYCAPEKPSAVIILCHGVDSNRMGMMSKARLLYNAGFGVLMFDFRTRGESGGNLCTLGNLEVDDLLAAVRQVHSNPKSDALAIGVLGDSLGGAVAIMGAARESSISAVVAESPFDRLDHAIVNHFSMVFGKASFVFCAPVTLVGEKLIGEKASSISPSDEIDKITPRPLLLIADADDRLCRKSEIVALFQRAGSGKELWTVPNADHIQANEVAPAEYERRIVEFFRKSLRK